jgi:hypothetical protein
VSPVAAANFTAAVQENRGHAIEAVIVRIMKARKTMSHQQLLVEILSQLSMFRPDAKVSSLSRSESSTPLTLFTRR